MRNIVADHILPVVTWTFVHSLWQGLVLTILAGLTMLVTRRSVAWLRYVLLCTLFFLFVGGVVASFLWEWNAGLSQGAVLLANVGDSNLALSLPRQLMESAKAFLNANAKWIVSVWLLVLVFKSCRMLLDMLYLQRLRNYGILALEDGWVERVQALAAELGIFKKVSFVESAIAKVPIVIGHFKPLILVPAGIVTNMPPEELEAILLHELAHIRRHDYLVNFIQRLCETVFFFNPGLLWVSSLLRVERENCCDDVAIAHTNNKLLYVEALICCKEHSLKAPRYAMGLFGKKNQLLQRMTRIVTNRNKTLSPVEGSFLILNLAAMIVLFSSMRSLDTQPLQPVAIVPSAHSVYSSYTTTLAKGMAVASKKDDVKIAVKQVRVEKLKTTKSELTSARIKEKGNVISSNALQSVNEDLSQGSKRLHSEEVIKHALTIKVRSEQEKALASQLESAIDRKQIEKDREQAHKDQEQAERYREQANKDREQADKDRQQAERDREQSQKDREQAMYERWRQNVQ